MTEEKILKKAIERAWANGYKDYTKVNYWHYLIQKGKLESIIFSHDFAKAFFGEETRYEKHIRSGECHGHEDVCGFRHKNIPAWKTHLQQLVLEEDKFKYLEKFIK